MFENATFGGRRPATTITLEPMRTPDERSLHFAHWLDATIENAGWSHREFAELVGVHESIVSRWLTPTAKPSIPSLEKMAKLLEVDLVQLAVTAGQFSEQHGERLPMPPLTAARARIRRELEKIPGLHEADIAAALQSWDARHRTGE